MSVEVDQEVRVPAPSWHKDGVPVYGSSRAPQHLRTRAQLAEARLKPAEDAAPVAYVDAEWSLGALFDPAEAVPMRPLNAAALKRRTCPECGQVGKHIVRVRCYACQEKARVAAARLAARTCVDCRATRTKPFGKGQARLCRTCKTKRAQEKRGADARKAKLDRSCPECGRRTATAAEIAAHRAERGSWSWRPRMCAPCRAREDRELRKRAGSCPSCGTVTTSAAELDAWLAQESEHPRTVYGYRRVMCEPCQTEQREREEQAREAVVTRRREELAALREWAAAALADPDVRILDTETTGLDDDARIVELAVLAADGTVLMDTLVNPGVKIPRQATAIHGITNDDVADAPAFAGIVEQLAGLLHGRRTLIYNSPYDMGVLGTELRELHPGDAAAVEAWLEAAGAEDAMMPYSEWVGEIHEYYGDVRWQRLEGGHRAAGDCRAVIRCLKAMAKDAAEDR